MKKTSKALASTAALCLVLSTTSVSAAENTAVAPERLGGKGRVDTAIKIAEKSFNNTWKNSGKAILSASADANLVDSLAVAPLSYQLKAPILLNDAKDSINAETLKSLKDNKVDTVYIATGEGVISNKAKAQLEKEGIKVQRLGGKNRYETAKNILDAFKKNGGKTETVALVSGTGLADALSVAPEAAKSGMPILLTNGKDAVAANLQEVAKAANKVYAIGGNGVISDALVQQLKADRLSGHTRYETNAEVIKKFAGKEFSKVYVGNGADEHLVDSLTGSVLAAQSGSPIVLSDGKLAVATKEVLKDKVTDKTTVVALGGEAVVSNELVKEVQGVAKEVEAPEVTLAEKAVKAFEDAKIETAEQITAAKALKAPAEKAIKLVKDQAIQEKLTARIAAKDQAIKDAEAKLGLKVESVSAINQNMIQIKFNKEVDATSAISAGNYTIDGTKFNNGAGYVSLEADGKTVDMFLAAPLTQDQKVTIGVSGVLEDKTYNKVADYNTTLTIKDVTNPTLVKAEAKNGNKDVYLTFSESLANSPLTLDMFTLNGEALSTFGATSVGYVQDTATSNGTKDVKHMVKISFASKLADGSYNIAVKDSKIKDPADFYAMGQSASFTTVADTQALSVVSTKATVGNPGTIEVKFNKDLGTLVSGYDVNDASANIKPSLKTGTKDTIIINTQQVKEGANIVVIPSAQRDSFGNKLGETDLRISVNSVKDTVKPTVENVYALSDKKVRVRFTENVNNAPFVKAKANWTIKDAAGDIVYSSNINAGGYSINPGVDGDNALVDIDFTTALPGSNYKLEVKGVKDGAGNEMDAYSTSFVSPDKTAPKLATTGNKAVANNTNRTIEVFFSEPMMVSSITDKNNFMYTKDGANFVSLPTTATLEAAANGKSVKITFPGTIKVGDIDNVKVLGVKDVAGNIFANGADVTGQPAQTLGVKPKVVAGSAVATADSDKVTVKFDTDQQIVAIDKADFAGFLTGTGVATGITPDNATVTGKTITLTYNNTNANYAKIKAAGKTLAIASNFIADAGNDTKNAYGDVLTSAGVTADDLKVKDEIAPELIAVNPIKVASPTTVTLQFNEAMGNENLGELKDDVVITTSGAYTSITTAAVTADTVELTTADNLTGKVTLGLVSDKISMKDAAGNVFKPTNANKNSWKIDLDAAGTPATEAKAATVTAGAEPELATAVGSAGQLVVKVDGTDATHTFTLNLNDKTASAYASVNELATAIADAVNDSSAKLSTVANVTVSGGKIVITSKSTGTSSKVEVTATGANDADVKTLTGFAGTETNAGTDSTPATPATSGNFQQK